MMNGLGKIQHFLEQYITCLCSVACIMFVACNPVNEENINSVYAVDLGLSVKWAWCNLGASFPEEEGNRYAWGETDVKYDYTYSNYYYADDFSNIGGNISGTVYDAAQVRLGEGWRMPTREEVEELITKCTWEKANLNAADGMFVTGPNGNKIFMPNVTRGAYWSGTFSSEGYYESEHNKSNALKWNYSLPWLSGGSANVRLEEFDCFEGLAIRPVKGDISLPDNGGDLEEDESPTIPQKVDLGLSVKWASCNVGAKSPEEYGDYFAWGETEAKSSYYENNSAIYWLSYPQSDGVIDSDGNLTAAYDVAMVNWGDEWRMPTSDEIEELMVKCSWIWITQNGAKGYKVTGPNGNFIFLPAAGYRYGTSLSGAGSRGDYWSASHLSNVTGCAYNLYFDSGYCYLDGDGIYKGCTVRPVTEK